MNLSAYKDAKFPGAPEGIQLSEDRLLVLPLEAEEKTKGGIIIPDSVKEKPRAGWVCLAGPGSEDYPMNYKVGDLIFYGKYTGSEFPLNGQEYLLMRAADIMGQIKLKTK
jgi:chaperonin GroES